MKQERKSDMQATEALPGRIADTEALEEILSRPDIILQRELQSLDGDIMVLGVGGKMGPSLAHMAKRAAPDKRVIGVARFSEAGLREQLEGWGIETIQCDLTDRKALEALPKAKNIVFMAGMKFGAGGDQPRTWAMNTYLPGLVAETFTDSRIVAFSTGCVYPFVGIDEIGATEQTPLNPPGEYANSCVGRERLFQYFSAQHGTPGRLIRLNYAIDLRYGVLHDLAVKIRDGKPVDLTTGHVNVIWQGDSNRYSLRALAHATAPTTPINVSGPETLSVKWLATELAQRLGKPVSFTGEPAKTAWLNNAAEVMRLFGYPLVSIKVMLDWVAEWVAGNGQSLNKPTKFENRDGEY
ncbi:NAD-dependent epimerase/dehydratase family protein [Ferrovibrio sp.]|uniref:NAD-dependent epimerase/dehydratase family protein n=1 Tax=Ferrovibrio sp. TaxID=1917215 RepID=UPI003D0A2E29